MDRATLIGVGADLADRDGFATLTLSDVAKAVERHPSSMYAHLASLDDLRQEIAVLAMGELADRVWRAVLGRVGADALVAIALEYADYAVAHPGRTAALAVGTSSGFQEAAARLHEPVQVTLRSFGLDDEQTAVAHRVFGATIDGWVRTSPGQDIRPAVGMIIAALETGTWPL